MGNKVIYQILGFVELKCNAGMDLLAGNRHRMIKSSAKLRNFTFIIPSTS